MKIHKLTILGICFVLQSAYATMPSGIPIECEGNVEFQGDYVDVSCTGGNCTGQISEQVMQLVGKCTADLDYVAEGKIAPVFVSGTCKNGVISSSTYSQNIILYGDCTYQDTFYGAYYSSIYSPVRIASGFCLENGMSRIYFNGGSRSVHGKCRQN